MDQETPKKPLFGLVTPVRLADGTMQYPIRWNGVQPEPRPGLTADQKQKIKADIEAAGKGGKA